jgi:glycerophosphoryl diester phosphodiesterase
MGASNNRLLSLLTSAKGSPVIIAHRGDSFHAPENTLEAARLAFESGAQAWELDVQLTRDGVPVVMHDESLTRTTNVAARFSGDPRASTGFRVADFDFDEVRTLDAGSWFVEETAARSARAFGTIDALPRESVAHFRSGKVLVPTLEESLIFTREHDWLVNVEIKSFPDRPPGLVEKVLDLIDATRTGDRVLISSFDHDDVAAANRPGRAYALGILLWTPMHRTHDYACDLVGAETVHASVEVLGSETLGYRRSPMVDALRSELVAGLNTRKLPLLAYTVNASGPNSLADHLAQLGLSGLFTDDPAGLRRFFADWERA